MPSVGSGSRIPPGGVAGDVLLKKSVVDYDAQWNSIGALGGGTSKITAAAVALGTQAGNQSAFIFYTVPAIAARGLVTQFTVTADGGGSFDLEVRGAGSSAGTLWLQAIAITSLVYANPTPWYVENDAAAQNFYIGVRNTGAASRTFTLSSLRVERFA